MPINPTAMMQSSCLAAFAALAADGFLRCSMLFHCRSCEECINVDAKFYAHDSVVLARVKFKVWTVRTCGRGRSRKSFPSEISGTSLITPMLICLRAYRMRYHSSMRT
jgi:hypothetical protein